MGQRDRPSKIRPPARFGVPQWDGSTVPFVMLAHHISLDSAPREAHRFEGGPVAVRSSRRTSPSSNSVHGAFSYPAAAARSGRGRLSVARWELAMLKIIQANHLAMNVLAVGAVFVFVGAVLLGAF